MTIAYGCVFIAIMMPLMCSWVAKGLGRFRVRDNSTPRDFMANLNGAAQRADWAQQNTLESVPAFMAAVIIAHQMGGDQQIINVLAVSYIAFRVLYVVFYLTNQSLLRSLVWGSAFACILGLFFS
jgi:uncharacterized MAPEG superfamily protein